jgi:hypothetical protein
MLTRSVRSFSIIVAAVVFACLLVPGTHAQTTYGSIVGTVRDASGGAVTRVAVTVTHEATNKVFSAVTTELGNYSFTTLIPGTYRVHAELTGFRPVEIVGIELQVNQTVRHDVVMQVGQVTEKVEVAATLSTLATETSDVGQVIANREIVELP